MLYSGIPAKITLYELTVTVINRTVVEYYSAEQIKEYDRFISDFKSRV